MKLKRREQIIHISHLHHLVSAYATSNETVAELVESIESAVVTAREEGKGQIVDQDCLENIIVVHPRGSLTFYREIGHYEIVEETPL